LRYGFQQQAMQQAFRKALKSAAEAEQDGKPSSVTHVIVNDKHIPSPSNPFGHGSIIPVSASASVVRNYHMQDNVPETYEELPQITINIQGQEASFKTAGFRDEFDVAEDTLKKYNEVYGSFNIDETGEGACLEDEIDEMTGDTTCINQAKNIRIIDSCAGEILDYSAAARQCRQIIDKEVCEKECERGKFPCSGTDCDDEDDEDDCNDICSYTMNVPSYCETAECGLNAECNKGIEYKYTFVKLNELFKFAADFDKPKNMGLQQDYTQETTTENTLKKRERPTYTRSSEWVNYNDTIQRTIIYNDALDEDGASKGAVNVTPYPVNTTTQFITCRKNSTDCIYGYKIVTCSGDDCGEEPKEKRWQTNW
ncbi:MAG: hypothetical protein V1925_01195, partial [Candidatus Omnitrophota bacterium]